MTRPQLAPNPFELFAVTRQFDVAPAVFPTADRVYADMNTQTLFDAWHEGQRNLARKVTESTFEIPALRDYI